MSACSQGMLERIRVSTHQACCPPARAMPEKQRGEPAAVLYTAPPHVRDARGNALLQPEARLSLSLSLGGAAARDPR